MIELLNMDCMEYMKGLPDKSFDLAIVDPPYFSGPEKTKKFHHTYDGSKFPLTHNQNYEFQKFMIEKAYKPLKEQTKF